MHKNGITQLVPALYMHIHVHSQAHTPECHPVKHFPTRPERPMGTVVTWLGYLTMSFNGCGVAQLGLL